MIHYLTKFFKKVVIAYCYGVPLLLLVLVNVNLLLELLLLFLLFLFCLYCLFPYQFLFSSFLQFRFTYTGIFYSYLFVLTINNMHATYSCFTCLNIFNAQRTCKEFIVYVYVYWMHLCLSWIGKNGLFFFSACMFISTIVVL